MKNLYLFLSLCLFGASQGQPPEEDRNDTLDEMPQSRQLPLGPFFDSTAPPNYGQAEGWRVIAFTALTRRLLHDIRTSRWNPVPFPFEIVVTNIGGAYDPSTGFFTAPIPGVYYFSFHSFCRGGIWPVGCSLYHNKREIVSGNPVSGSNSAVLELHPGDRVYVSAWWSGKLSNNQHDFSSFSGYLIQNWLY